MLWLFKHGAVSIVPVFAFLIWMYCSLSHVLNQVVKHLEELSSFILCSHVLNWAVKHLEEFSSFILLSRVFNQAIKHLEESSSFILLSHVLNQAVKHLKEFSSVILLSHFLKLLSILQGFLSLFYSCKVTEQFSSHYVKRHKVYRRCHLLKKEVSLSMHHET